jgi:hypothetical protein
MRVKVWVCLVLLGVISLTPLAYASPPDPSWIRGLYDGGDFDDIVVLLTGGTGIVEPFPAARRLSTPGCGRLRTVDRRRRQLEFVPLLQTSSRPTSR